MTRTYFTTQPGYDKSRITLALQHTKIILLSNAIQFIITHGATSAYECNRSSSWFRPYPVFGVLKGHNRWRFWKDCYNNDDYDDDYKNDRLIIIIIIIIIMWAIIYIIYRSHPVVFYHMIKQFIQSNTTHTRIVINT
jgi:hypothetical protein